MFVRLSEPLSLSEAGLLALRPALNVPVLNVSFLPVGPARAAIVAFAEEWGGVGLALGIRSNESGQVAVFRNRDRAGGEGSPSSGMAPLVAEAERLGFLFDEDMVEGDREGRGRERALALWSRLTAEVAAPPTPIPASNAPASHDLPASGRPSLSASGAQAMATSLPLVPSEETDPMEEGALELVLEERVPEIDLGVEAVVVAVPSSSPPAPEPSPGPEGLEACEPACAPDADDPGAARLPLSKFRDAEDRGAASAAANPLGRIPLVRVRQGKGHSAPSRLARLLSSF